MTKTWQTKASSCWLYPTTGEGSTLPICTHKPLELELWIWHDDVSVHDHKYACSPHTHRKEVWVVSPIPITFGKPKKKWIQWIGPNSNFLLLATITCHVSAPYRRVAAQVIHTVIFICRVRCLTLKNLLSYQVWIWHLCHRYYYPRLHFIGSKIPQHFLSFFAHN